MRSMRGRGWTAFAVGMLLSACRGEGGLPGETRARQSTLGERITQTAVSRASGVSPEDAALALGEVVVPGLSARLRLIVAESDGEVARGAAVALVRIRRLRADDEGEALVRCLHQESNATVRGECLRQLEGFLTPRRLEAALFGLLSRDPQVLEAALVLLERHAAEVPRALALELLERAWPPEALLPLWESARNAVVAGVSRTPPAPQKGPVVPLLGSRSTQKRLEGLRRLLAQPQLDGEKGARAAVLRLIADEDPAVRLLAQAAMLRRSLAENPPAAAPTAPDVSAEAR